jgi:ribosome-binding protein aMBF1 (putative translation factor)
MSSKPLISDQLRRAIEQSGMSRYRISRETGINESVLSRFVHSETSLSLETVDSLCALLGARLVVESTPVKQSKRSPKK